MGSWGVLGVGGPIRLQGEGVQELGKAFGAVWEGWGVTHPSWQSCVPLDLGKGLLKAVPWAAPRVWAGTGGDPRVWGLVLFPPACPRAPLLESSGMWLWDVLL